MHILIYRNEETTTFISLFNQLATDYTSKLKFITKEEYFSWLKQWKEDYKIIDRKHKVDKFVWFRDHCVIQKKIELYQKRLDAIPDFTPEENARYAVLCDQYLSDFNLKPWFVLTRYLVWYMLIIRTASKLRANSQWHILRAEKLVLEKSMEATRASM